MSIARSVGGDRLDWICRRHYGELFPGAVEAVLDANPGLAALGPVLPAGVEHRDARPHAARRRGQADRALGLTP